MRELDGDEFERWYVAEHPRLLAWLTVAAADPTVAQDLASEAFVRAYERWDRVAAMEAPTAWVRTVAANLLRRRMRRATLEAALLRRHRPPGPHPAPAVEPEVWAAVRALPPRQRAVLALRIVLDLPQEEVAKLLGIRPGTVSATLHAARLTLGARLDAPDPQEVTSA